MHFNSGILEGDRVRLEPLAEHHVDGLLAAISDGELWKLFVTIVPAPDKLKNFFHQAQSLYQSGDGITYATIEKGTNQVVGSTRFMRAHLAYKRTEIGYTFLGKRWQKTGINTEAKFLMLRHAFETMQLNRVELLTDFLNFNSRAAIARLGAREEGILRSHMVMPDGRVRDSVIFSIIAQDWPGVKCLLQSKLAAA